METLLSPFRNTFHEFVDTIRADCILCSPYITGEPVRHLVQTLNRKGLQNHVKVNVLTDISAVNLVQGSTDIDSLLLLMEGLSGVQLTYLPRIHAKVLVADEKMAIVGSANFTEGGAMLNQEYGVRISEPNTIRKIRKDMEGYSALGSLVSYRSLKALSEKVHSLTPSVREAQKALKSDYRDLQDELFIIRNSNKSAMLRKTILYLLQNGPMKTEEMHPLIQAIHPDLFDYNTNYTTFKDWGKKWKHHVRNARQALKTSGELEYDKARDVWRITGDTR